MISRRLGAYSQTQAQTNKQTNEYNRLDVNNNN